MNEKRTVSKDAVAEDGLGRVELVRLGDESYKAILLFSPGGPVRRAWGVGSTPMDALLAAHTQAKERGA